MSPEGETAFIGDAEEAARVGRAAYVAGIRLLARREHSVAEMATKLGRSFPAPTVGATVENLQAEGVLSDARFAEALCRSRIARGYGPGYITQELRQKGVGRDTYAGLLDYDDDHWLALASQLVQRKYPEINSSHSTLGGGLGARQDDESTGEREGFALNEEEPHTREISIEQRQKLSRFLARRGFSAGIISKVQRAL